jgi:hypothetical protein
MRSFEALRLYEGEPHVAVEQGVVCLADALFAALAQEVADCISALGE